VLNAAANALELITLLVLWIITLARLPAAVRSSRQRPVWLVIAAITASVTATRAPVEEALRRITGITQIPELFKHLAVIVASSALLVVVARITATSRGRSTAALTILPRAAIGVSIAMAAIFPWAADHAGPDYFLPTEPELSPLTAYWVVYLGYVTVMVVFFSRLFLRYTRSAATGPLRTSLPLIGLGMLGAAVYVLLRAALLLIPDNQVVIELHRLASFVTFLAFSAGVAVSSSHRWRKAIRDYRSLQRLYPLWRTLYTAVPHIALERPRPRLIDGLTFRVPGHRLYRRIIEIRDGLLTLREWVTPERLEQIHLDVSAAGLTGDDAEAATTYCWMEAARLAKEQKLPTVEEPPDIVRHGGADIDSELRWLLQVAAARDNRQVRACVARINAERV